MINKIQLISYPDSLGGNLTNLKWAIDTYFKDAIAGIHILPPFKSSGDRGFAPLNYFDIDPKFGNWEDISQISSNYPIMLDIMVNHLSQRSVYFQDILRNGNSSPYFTMFLTVEKVGGYPNPIELATIFRRRELPYSTFLIGNEKKDQAFWTTFGKENPSEQIDLDVNSSLTRKMFEDIFHNFSARGIKFIRLDAIGYVTKKLGTKCFFIEPEIMVFMKWINDLANKYNLLLLPEVHAQYTTQYNLAKQGFWIYDFILPYVVLSTMLNRDCTLLNRYLIDRPTRQITVLDCHDGVPIKPDLDDLVAEDDILVIVNKCLNNGANFSYVFQEKENVKNKLGVHQIRGTYFSLLDCNEDAYIMSRAIQFFVPGIPQIYYVGLLVGENDVVDTQQTDGREINRHNYSLSEIQDNLDRKVVQRLLKLMEFRNNFPAFDGLFSNQEISANEICFIWEIENESCTLIIDLTKYTGYISYKRSNGEKGFFEL